MDIVIMIAQLLLGLTFLVAIHEWGHMFSAKRFGMRVEKFSIGMPPKIYGKKIGETEYSIGALPIGGFVKISGIIDENMDKEQMAQEPQPWEFRAKPTWQRLIVMLGGIIVNTIAGIIIFSALTYSYGETFLPNKEVKYGIVAGSIAQEIGLKTGDKIIKVNGEIIEDFEKTRGFDVLLGENSTYTIDRKGVEMEIAIPNDMLKRLDGGEKMGDFISARQKFEIAKIIKKSNASKSDLQPKDKILKVNESSFNFFDEFRELLKVQKNQKVDLVVLRNGAEILVPVQVDSVGNIGVAVAPLFKFETREFGIGESISKGSSKAFNVVFSSVKAIKKVVTGQADFGKTFHSPIKMAEMYGSKWDWYRFWSMTGLISMALAFMNLLPIPALDGGHCVFIIYEMISGRKPHEKVLEYAQIAGMALLLMLMLFTFGNDILSYFN